MSITNDETRPGFPPAHPAAVDVQRSPQGEGQYVSDDLVAIINSLPGQIALIDSAGIIRVVNDAWRSFADALPTSEFAPGTNYVDKNYREALLALERQGAVGTTPKERRAGTFGPNVRVTFPPKE